MNTEQRIFLETTKNIEYDFIASSKQDKLVLVAYPLYLDAISSDLEEWKQGQDKLEEILIENEYPIGEIDGEPTPDYIYELEEKRSTLEKFKEDHTEEISISTEGYIGDNLLYTTDNIDETAKEAARNCLTKNLHNLPDWIEQTEENKNKIKIALTYCFKWIIGREQEEIESFFRCEMQEMTIEKLRQLDADKQTEIVEQFYRWLCYC